MKASHFRTTLAVIVIAALAGACTVAEETTAWDPPAPVSYPEFAYPEAERGDVVEDYFGVQVTDPYRWLEGLDEVPTAEWVESQNSISRPFLEALPAREEIKARLTELWSHERFGQPFKEGDKYFYSRNDGLQNQSVLYVADALDGEPRVSLDPNGFSEDGTVSLGGMSVSPGARYIAYATSDGGSDWRDWHVLDVEAGEDLPDLLQYTKFSGADWSTDGAGFYYARHPVAEDGSGDGTKAVSVYYHRAGTEQADDVLVYEVPEQPEWNPSAETTEDGRYLLLNISHGYLENAVYYRDLEATGPPTTAGDPVVKLLDDWDALYLFMGNIGSTFYFQTTLDAPKNRVIAIDVDNPARENWQEIIPEAESVLRSASLVGEKLVATYLEDAKSVVRVFEPDGSHVRDVELPGIGSARGFSGRVDDPETFYTFTSFTTPGSVYRYDLATGESTLLRRPEVDFDPDAFETVQVFYESADGTRVPMFITHPVGIDLNGNNPTLLTGYGGFNISMTPGFRLERVAWLERGGIVAVPNLRGGGEYGREWHMAGARLNKQNVFDDFIAAAEWLIDNGYTSTPRLAIQGGSNGGLLVGAVLTQRPDLFGATLPAVGVLDMIRYHMPSANARNWQNDYGLSENEDDFYAQYAYSPLHNVDSGTCYPPTLITTADHDDRVVPWHSFKFGATMQWAQECENPIFVRVETRAGHGAGTPTWMRIEGVADQYAFLVHALGMDDGEM